MDSYKSDRWYLVACTGCTNKNGSEAYYGYVLATLLRPDYIRFEEKASDCSSRTQIQGKPIDRIVLHGTAGSGLSGALSTFNNCIGAHFYVGRDGQIVQAGTVDKLIWHAGYGGSKSRKELVNNTLKNSYTSIGIEIVSVGLAKNQSDNSIPDIDTVFSAYWNVWKAGLHWGGFTNGEGNSISIDSKKWHFYTDEQYKALNNLLSYLEESTGIPYKVSLYKDENDKNNGLGYYYNPLSPSDISSSTESEAYKKQTTIINNYLNNLFSFRGIVDHHTKAGKWDMGPAFDICNRNLDFNNVRDFCKK